MAETKKNENVETKKQTEKKVPVKKTAGKKEEKAKVEEQKPAQEEIVKEETKADEETPKQEETKADESIALEELEVVDMTTAQDVSKKPDAYEKLSQSHKILFEELQSSKEHVNKASASITFLNAIKQSMKTSGENSTRDALVKIFSNKENRDEKVMFASTLGFAGNNDAKRAYEIFMTSLFVVATDKKAKLNRSTLETILTGKFAALGVLLLPFTKQD